MSRIFLLLARAVAVVLFCPALACASTWQTYTVDSGLPGQRVLSFAVKKNQMAVGTDNGIAVFSGDSCLWTVVPLPDEVASCEVRDLGYDRNGNLWAATARGLINIQSQRVLVYGAGDRLPNVDVQRLQIVGDWIFVGCFGGFVARAAVPSSGKASFVAVNYDANAPDDSLKIRSVGVSGLGMLDTSRGWFSTLGEGMVEVMGSSQTILSREQGLMSDWVEAFWLFKGGQDSQHILAVSSGEMALIKDGRLLQSMAFPEPAAWLTALAAFDEKQEYKPSETISEEERTLRAFLGDRTIWVGTKNHGLWRRRNGEWTQYLPGNSRLLSATILRLYPLQQRLVVCTDQGLVIVPLTSHQYDEFAKQGIGSRNFKTLFPMPPLKAAMIRFNQILRSTDMWFSHQHGLSRFISASGLFQGMLHDNPEVTGSVDSDWTFTSLLAGEDNTTPGGAPTQRPGERAWQMYSTRYFVDKAEDLPIYSDDITCMTVTPENHVFMIFEKKVFARLRMIPLPPRSRDDEERREKPQWDYFTGSIPWGDCKLLSVWHHNGRLFVGTEGDGFYVLTNPSCIENDPKAYDWKKYGTLEGLVETTVTGFTTWNPGGNPLTVLMHPKAVTVWNETSFDPLILPGNPSFTCLAGDSQGNLWLGTKTGLLRVHDDMRVSSYSGMRVGFDSDHITAIGVVPAKTGQPVGIWVANDQLADRMEIDSLANGSDQPPNVITRDGKKVLLELEIDGSSLHFFDGLVWDKWKVPGVRSMYIDDEFLWLSTNIRVRRLRLR
ncbi:MAG TPA: two-component regulator propeller domain-containing protein [Candidatus Ozemobacteraceae bacterium]|nr:two-component regulator propeller domain-containing protein [Candidatus Ozemobacteraceae bacterium]